MSLLQWKMSEREKRVNRAINVVIYTTLSQWSLTIIRQSNGRPHGHHASSFMGVSRRRCKISCSHRSSFIGVSRRRCQISCSHRSSFTGVSRRPSQIPWSHGSRFTGVSRRQCQISWSHGSSFTGVLRRRCQLSWSQWSSFSGVSRRRSQIPWNHVSFFLNKRLGKFVNTNCRQVSILSNSTRYQRSSPWFNLLTIIVNRDHHVGCV